MLLLYMITMEDASVRLNENSKNRRYHGKEIFTNLQGGYEGAGN